MKRRLKTQWLLVLRSLVEQKMKRLCLMAMTELMKAGAQTKDPKV